LLLPCWWSAALASIASGKRWPDPLLLALFGVGAVVMRGAGCAWNDIVDRDIDAKVARTRSRPIPSGQITVVQALVFAAALSLVGLVILLQFNWFAIGVGDSSLVIVALYPFAKRVTFWPQFVLGLAFSWGFLASKLDDDEGDGNPFDEYFPTINDEDDDIADHAWVQDDQGLYHLYFQNEGHSGTFDIEHYTSSDLQTLQYVGVALRANPAGWDSRGLWAPHVVRLGDTWFLFYAGVNGTGPQSQQRIGLAVSQDLHQWTRVVSQLPLAGDGAIYDCRETWTTWGSGQNFDDQCRDPFVTWDATQQRWVLFATARSIDGYAVVTVATTTNLLDWTGQGYIDATRRLPNGIAAQRTGGEAEIRADHFGGQCIPSA
jgi:hypothetical protein